jgi:iron(III) transport system ATP-binding protein
MSTKESPSVTSDDILELHDVSRSFGNIAAVAGASLTVAHGEIVALLGPSGCGKSTLLQLIAGLLTPDSGCITLGGKTVADRTTFVEPNRRRVGMVFQDHALFPHLDVRKNISFGLRGLSKSEQLERVEELLVLVQLSEKIDRPVHELSGGEQQRVALARALAPRPKILVLDEPFASLDRVLTDQLRADVVKLLRAANTPVVFVTHDAGDAMAAADRVAVMRAGRIVQVGTPVEVHDHPVDEGVAGIFGPVNAVQSTRRLGGSKPLRPWDLEIVGVGCGADTAGDLDYLRGFVASARFLGFGWRLSVQLTQSADLAGEEVSDSLSDDLGLGDVLVDVDRNAPLPPMGAEVLVRRRR